MSVLVTGAAMGIGKAVALQLAGEGKNLVLVDVAEAELAETGRLTRELGGSPSEK